MFCDNCGAQVDDDATFCSKCGQQLIAEKAAVGIPPPTRAPRYARRSEDNLCFGEQREENPWVSGIVVICIGLFLAVIFFDLDESVPIFQIEYLLVFGFLALGAILIIQAIRKRNQGG